jgi:hypothetical protein
MPDLYHFSTDWADIFANYDPKHAEKVPLATGSLQGRRMPLE